LFDLPVLVFQYEPPVGPETKVARPVEEQHRVPMITMTPEEFRDRIAAEREVAIAETESRLKREYEHRSKDQAAKVAASIQSFQHSCRDYFSRVESEVVQLALGIARKILHRESQVDPTLVAAIVQIALGQLKEGSVASLRVSTHEGQRWKEHFATLNLLPKMVIVEDVDLSEGDCILETEVGSLNVSVDGQLKEIERGFLDVLAHRPKL
jgi:flagellar assembly protein FliH